MMMYDLRRITKEKPTTYKLYLFPHTQPFNEKGFTNKRYIYMNENITFFSHQKLINKFFL